MAQKNGAQAKTVWVVNRSAHDFSAASSFGTISFLSNGLLRKKNVAYMARLFEEALRESKPDDYLLPTSLTIMSIVAALIFARKHGKVNFLLYEDGKYRARTLILEELENGRENRQNHNG